MLTAGGHITEVGSVFTCWNSLACALLPGPERVWSGNALLSRYGIFSVPAKLLLLRLILEIKIAASQPVRSSERARSALEAAGTGWLDAGGCPVVSAGFSLI